MKKTLFAPCCALLAACSSAGGDSRVIQLPNDGPAAEIVNGTPVPQTLLDAIARGRGLHLDKPDQREQALKLATDLVLMAQAAQREHFDADPQLRADAEAARLKAIAEGAVAAYEQRTPISDELLKAQYDSEVSQAGKFDYDFTQLLFAEQAEAMQAEEELLSGKSFAQVFDAWRGKAKQAKAFSGVHTAQLPQELVKVLDELKDGDITKLPVKTEFGWHVLRRDAAHPFTPPPFEQVREKLRRTMLLQAGQQRLEKLREQAKVEYPAAAAPAKKD
jgi:peptidyl-prolyl cis-trans isomerase C